MGSIPKSATRGKYIVRKGERKYKIVKGDLGTQVRREPLHIWHKHRNTPKRKRGDIKGFSRNSQSRLRVALSTARFKCKGECRRYGFTLTLPWAANADEWREVWNAFSQRMVKQYADVGIVWRIELTTGKAARSGGLRRCHVHAVVWLPIDLDIMGKHEPLANCDLTDDIRNIRASAHVRAVARAWVDAWWCRCPVQLSEAQMRYATSCGERKGNGILVKWLGGSTDGVIHYLCDHASKHKEEQLGWQGRQWGIINRRNFSFEYASADLSGKEWAIVSRTLRRCRRGLLRSGKYAAQPYGDNKCFFGSSEKRLEQVLQAVRNGRIS